jgi:hypothetical protein
MSLKDKLTQMAETLIDEAMAAPVEGKTALVAKERVDIFKATSMWYLGVQKMKDKDPDDEPGETFDAIRNRLNGDSKGQIQ